MKKIYDYLIGIIFLAIGIIFLGITVFMNNSDKEFIKHAYKTIGTIENIDIDYGIDDTDYDVYVSYKDISGNIHRGRSDYSSSSMRVGDKITVYYDKENPDKFRVKKEDYLNYIFIGMSGLFIILGGVLSINPIIQTQKGNKLMKNGIKLTATISSVLLNNRYQVNGRSPYIINVSFMYQDLLYEARSKNIWYDVELIIKNNNIKELPIYIEINNPKKYYLDTSEFEKYIGK